jgi:hypothetical protein
MPNSQKRSSAHLSLHGLLWLSSKWCRRVSRKPGAVVDVGILELHRNTTAAVGKIDFLKYFAQRICLKNGKITSNYQTRTTEIATTFLNESDGTWSLLLP